MKWRDIEEEQPEIEQECMFVYKHGYISGEYQGEDQFGQKLGYSYVWQELTYLVYKWIPLQEFEDSVA